MRRSFLIIAALAALCTASRAQAGATASARRGADEKVRAELRKLHEDINEAAARRDRAALERLYADEFVYIHSTGRLETKAEWITRSLTINRSRTMEPASAPPAGERELHVYDDVAISRGHNALTVAGEPNPRSLWLTFVYVKRGGRWRLALQQGTPIPAPRAAVTVGTETLDAYAGEYEYANGDHVRIAREGDTLTTQRTGRPKTTLVPASATKFFVKDTDSELNFFRDGQGRVTHFTIRRGARAEETAKKIK